MLYNLQNITTYDMTIDKAKKKNLLRSSTFFEFLPPQQILPADWLLFALRYLR